MISVKCISKRNIYFYKTIGPYLGNRAIEKEIGYHIYDDPKQLWFFAYVDNTFAGFVTLSGNNCKVDYVLPKYRKMGVHFALAKERLKYCHGKVRITCNDASKKTMLKLGFKEVRKTYYWTWLELNVE